MRKVYLTLAILGFILPTVFVAIESIETGNILLYADPMATLNGMLANRISFIFAIDLFFAVRSSLYGPIVNLKSIISNQYILFGV